MSALVLGLTPVLSRLPLPPVAAPLPQALLWPAAAIAAFLFNTMDDGHKALRADITTLAECNRLSAWSVVVLMWSQVTILVLGYGLWPAAVGDAAFLVAAGLMALGVLRALGGVREPPPAAWPPARAAAALCLVTFAYWSGVNAVLPLVSVYLRNVLGASVGEAQRLPALLLAATLCALPVGRLGARSGQRRVLALGSAIMGVAALLGRVITTKEQGALVFLLAGAGNAASTVLTIPLLADLVPR